MAKSWNIVVHHYDEVDAEIVVGILKRDLLDSGHYRDAIVHMLRTNST